MSKWLVAPLVVSTACFSQPHTRLTAPPAGASAETRLRAYQDHRPRAESTTTVIADGRPIERRTDFLLLGNGKRVYHPEDLTPLVAPGSPTAEAAGRSARARRSLNAWWYVGGAMVAVGAGFLITSIARGKDDPGFDENGELKDRDLFTTYDALGMGLIAGGILTPIIGSAIHGRDAQDERITAFAMYEDDLRKQLDVCVDGLNIVACGAPAVAPAAPVAPPAAEAPAAAAP